MSVTDQIIQVESGGDPYAQNPSSSAGGLGQFTDQTWLNTVRAHRPDLAARYSPQELLSLKSDRTIGRQMVQALASDNGSYLRSRGLDPTPGNLYLAHFAGAGGAAKVLGADDSAPVSQVLSQDAITANPFLRNMTVADLKNWAARKMGDSSAPAAAAAQPSGAPGALPTMEAAAPFGGGGAQQASSAPASNPLGALASLIGGAGQQQPDQTEAPQMHVNFPEPPGLVRARMLARAMASHPLDTSYSTGGRIT